MVLHAKGVLPKINIDNIFSNIVREVIFMEGAKLLTTSQGGWAPFFFEYCSYFLLC